MNKQFGIAQLKAFNEWRDEILIEVSTVLLIIGFIMGTVDVFIGGGIANDIRFKIAWAIVQALSIDGLFFAVWGKVAKTQWTRANLQRNIPLVAVGTILAIVAALVNDILTYQQVNSLVSSIDAIKQLGIDVQTFTTSRAILVVGVGVLVQLFCRSDGTDTDGTPGTVITEQVESGTVVNVNVLQNNGTPVKQVQDAIGTPIALSMGHQRDTQDNETVEKVRVILKEQPTISVRSLAKTLGVPKTTAANWRLKALEPVEAQP